jgi:poly-gamma-glutamate capsule biosynthesis protein CapA/YwtB (metallophosphatase superfamily)
MPSASALGREGTIASWIANGRRVALVAFAPNVGSNSLNDPQIGLPLVTQLAATHDIVIVSFHGGAEGNGAEILPFAREIFAGEDRGNVVEFAHAMIDAGRGPGDRARTARGAAMELYRDRLIAYSLGNFATYYGISVEGIRGIAPILLWHAG